VKPKTKAALILLGAVALVWLVVWPVYLSLPDIIPAHMDLAGNVDRWGSKLEVLIMPIVFTVVVLLTVPIIYVAPVEDEEGLVKVSLMIAIISTIISLMQPLGTYLGGNNGPELSRFMDAAVAVIVIIFGLFMPASSDANPQRPFCGLPSTAPLPTPAARQKAALIGRTAFVLHGSIALLLVIAGLSPVWTTIYLVGGLVLLAVGMCYYFKRYLDSPP